MIGGPKEVEYSIGCRFVLRVGTGVAGRWHMERSSRRWSWWSGKGSGDCSMEQGEAWDLKESKSVPGLSSSSSAREILTTKPVDGGAAGGGGSRGGERKRLGP